MRTRTITNSSSANMLKKAMHIASCYGFDPIEKIAMEQKKRGNDLKEKRFIMKKISRQEMKDLTQDLSSNGIISTLQSALEYKLLPSDQPILIHHSSIGAELNKISNKDTVTFCLVAIGMNKSIAEALILKTAYDILSDIIKADIRVCINSIGDKYSTQKFVQELNLYLRKNASSLPSQAKHSLIKKDILNAYEQLHTMHHPIETEIPQSIKFLSDNSRKHLSEIIEYMEIGNIPYEIDNFLVGRGNLYSQTLFEIRNIAEAQESGVSVFAKGGRCDEISRRLFNHDMPTVAIALEFEKKGVKEKKLNTPKRTRKPKIYFIQLGSEAKLKSLHVIESLRKINIKLYHSLNNDKFREQLAFAQNLEVPYAIIMGHREALDGTVIVRNMDTQFQNTILIEKLPEYLKNIKV